MKENKLLKTLLVLQSFAPLFLLLFIRHFSFSFPRLCIRFFVVLFIDGFNAFKLMWNHPEIGDFAVSAICCAWLIFTLVMSLLFRSMQTHSFDSHGEEIVVGEEKRDVGATFLVTFVLPLLMDDVATARGFITFVVMMVLVITLLIKSNMFYQNPMLTIYGYRIFAFKFSNPYKMEDKEYIGITHGKKIDQTLAIKRKYIADDVFFVFNE